MKRYDVIVIGTGAIGAATTYQLAKAGVDVLGLDQFEPPHAHGSSHGDTRITREIYNVGPQIDLVRRSHELWREMEAIANTSLLTTTGGIFIGNPSDSTWSDSLSSLAHEQGIEHEQLSAAEATSRFHRFG